MSAEYYRGAAITMSSIEYVATQNQSRVTLDTIMDGEKECLCQASIDAGIR